MTTTLCWAGIVRCPDHVRQHVRWQLGLGEAVSDDQIVDAMISTVLHSRAALAVLPLQDVLHLGSEARMNTPGTDSGNWTWRFDWDDLPTNLASHLLIQLQHSDRCGTPPLL